MRLLLAALAAAFSFGHALAEPRFSFSTTPGKLPKDVVPRHYALRITPGADAFEGEAVIDIDVARPVPAIVLNASDLRFKSARLSAGTGAEQPLAPTFDPKQETVALAPSRPPIAAGSYRLEFAYSGKIGRHPQGLYRIAYKQEESGRLVEKTMLATQMEPVSARKLFPGWDEPVFRATFEISAVVDGSLAVVSNMAQSKSAALPGGRKEVSFARSPAMASYLVALFIGEMDVLEDDVDGIRLRIYTAKGKRERARYAMESTKQIVHWYDEYFGERYPLDKLDQVALPGGIGGAMENWGAIAYNEARLLYDPRDDSPRQQQQVYDIMAHEIAHQWFGNLVTMAWWNDLWLNESFATWMAGKTTERFNRAWQMQMRYALGREWALGEDARRTTHPIQTPVENDARAMEVFDSISYAKGGSVLRMLEAYLGEDVFREGIRRYMRAHRLSNSTTADLWHHLSEASRQDIQKLVSGWTEQPGYPVVRISQRCDEGETVVALRQERFTLNDPGAKALTWRVPVMLADAAGVRRTVLLEERPLLARFRGCGTFLANSADTGYYRVQYDGGSPRVDAEMPKLAPLGRLRLLSDTFALVQAGRADATRYLALVESLGEETDRSVWDQVIGSLGFFRDLIDKPEEGRDFDRYAAGVLRGPFARVGWDARAGEPPDAAMLRRSLIDALGRTGQRDIVREAQARFASDAPLDPATRPAVLDVVGRYADEATFKALLAKMRAATDVKNKWEALSALSQARDPKLLAQLMELMMTDELPPGDAVYYLTHLTGDGRSEQCWRFVLSRLPDVLAKASERQRPYVLPNAASGFSDAAHADELIALTRARLGATAMYQAEKTADWIRLKAAAKEREAGRAVAWARAHARPG
ncbi:MAG TPA: M1 family metallopeptidase [Burkholderiales bacterium]|nr:M1 family metallopeptidase [Burkholderiales bacterium]